MGAVEALIDPAYFAAALACFIIMGSAVWASHRFAGFRKLPRQFGLTLKPRAFAPRWLMVWGVPLFLTVMLALVAVMPALLTPEQINENPSHRVIIASAVTVSAQGFILWLLNRWANGQA